MEIIPDEEEVTIDAIPLVVNYTLKSFDREDLETLYKLVKAKYKSTRLVEDLDLVLWNDLKTMFEPHVEDVVWRNQQDYKVLSWKLHDSCGVHFLRMQHVQIYMLVEKRYPLTPPTITDMLNKKLQGRIVGIKSLLNAASITAAHIRVNAAQLNGNTAPKTILWKGVEKVMPPTTAEEKAQKRLRVKAYSSSSTQNMAFVSSSNNNNSSTNGAVSTAQAVNTANGVSAANTQLIDANFDNLRE
ncbi:hypothetical protein Tco_0045821 [Tanacetum coccineum]